jgi:hypothetical protein
MVMEELMAFLMRDSKININFFFTTLSKEERWYKFLKFFTTVYRIEFLIAKELIIVSRGNTRILNYEETSFDIGVEITILKCINYCNNPF